jgi:hypothetical protein
VDLLGEHDVAVHRLVDGLEPHDLEVAENALPHPGECVPAADLTVAVVAEHHVRVDELREQGGVLGPEDVDEGPYQGARVGLRGVVHSCAAFRCRRGGG